MALSPWDRVAKGPLWSRKRLTRRDWALLEDAARAAGVPLRVIQGSWASGGRSAGTHTGAGAADLSVRGMTRAQRLRFVNELRKRNCAAWLRSAEFGWRGGDHIHLIVKDTPGKSYMASRQVINYNAGQNGLANKRRDPHARPAQHKFVIGGMGQPPVVTTAVAVRLANLRYGARRSDDVKDLQRALKITADGLYGDVTDAAVRAHQKKMGLTPDPKGKSYVGPKQAKALSLKVI